MITVVGGIKGGSGKTTIATNLAVLRSKTKKILLVDADDQKSAWDWSQQRDSVTSDNLHGSFVTVCMSGKSVYTNLIKLKEDYEDIIVDTGGRDTKSLRAALSIADIFVSPFKPSSIDIWTMTHIKDMLSECINPKLKVYGIISQADPIGKDNVEAKEILKEFSDIHTLDITIGNRKAFRNAAAEGLAVCEMPFIDKKAHDEMLKLYEIIYR
jgi:chromosome partitioning protein